MSAPRVLLDTSFLIALENRDDVYHRKALDLVRHVIDTQSTLVLHQGIVLELFDGYAKLTRRQKAVELFAQFNSEDGYELIPLTDNLFDAGIAIYQSRKDKQWGLTDCISFALMERMGCSEALTADHHFVQAGFRALLLESA